MSHDATNWAIKQRGLKPVTRLVLWHLADHHNPSFGCFPSQAALVKSCEISRASLNRHLAELEQRGLIRRQQRVDKATGQQENTRYFLSFEPGFAAMPRVSNCDTGPDPETLGKSLAPAVENSEARVSKTGGSVSQSCETQTCKEPESPLTPQPGLAFEALVHKWPPDHHGNLSKAEQAFLHLDQSDQLLAAQTAEPTLVALVRLKRSPPKLVGYLANRLFAEFADAPEIDGDGRYVITPTRQEWGPWIGWIRDKHGQTGVDSIVKAGQWLPKTRWPDAHSNSRRAGNGHR